MLTIFIIKIVARLFRSGATKIKPMSAINWKSTGMGEWYGFYLREMVMRISTADGPLFYVAGVPSVQYGSEAELIRFLNLKHRAA